MPGCRSEARKLFQILSPVYKVKKRKKIVLPNPRLPLARHQFMLPDHGYGASALCGMPIYAPAFSSNELYCLATEQLALGC